jgi:uncharacterized cupin superfamily protein
MKNCRFIGRSADSVPLQSAPIEPGWILAGTPQARSAEVARSSDGASNTMVWDCTAGTFRWYFGLDETVHILKGEVFVSDEHGNNRLLRAGDIGFFPAGTWMVWRVDNYVRKIAFLRHPLPLPFGALLRVFNYGLNVVRLKARRYTQKFASF